MSVLEGGLGGALGMDGGWLPLPTRLQRYCDPASLVSSSTRFDNTGVQIFFLLKEVLREGLIVIGIGRDIYHDIGPLAKKNKFFFSL